MNAVMLSRGSYDAAGEFAYRDCSVPKRIPLAPLPMSVESLDEIVMTTPEDERGAHRSDVGSVVEVMTSFERRQPKLRLAGDRAVVEVPAEQVAQEQRERLGAIADERAPADRTEGPVDG